MTELGPIDWSGCTYSITENTSMAISSHSPLSRETIILDAVRAFEENTPHDHYVYCFKYDDNGRDAWYVGETSRLLKRFYSHSRDKNLMNIERVEGVDSEEAALREHHLHAETILEKDSKNVWGGH